MIAAVVLNWNRAELTETAARSLARQVDLIVLVDNASREHDRQRLERFAAANGAIFVQSPRNGGYAAGNNLGIARALEAGAGAVLVLNNDATAEPGCVALLAARLAEAPEVGVVAPAVVSDPGGEVMHTSCHVDPVTGAVRWLERGRPLAAVDPAPRPTPFASGEAFLARAAVFRGCGAFDERFFCYFEDTEWGARVRRAGWEIEVLPRAVVRHVAQATSGSLTAAYYMARNRPLFLRRGLGHSRAQALLGSGRAELRLALSHLRKRRFRHAVRGSLAGWAAGATLLLTDGRGR